MQQHVPPQRRGLPPHEKRRQRANQLSVIVYVMASLIFIAIMLFNMRGDAYIGAEKGDQKILGAALNPKMCDTEQVCLARAGEGRTSLARAEPAFNLADLLQYCVL